jgi:hypothetical protein
MPNEEQKRALVPEGAGLNEQGVRTRRTSLFRRRQRSVHNEGDRED